MGHPRGLSAGHGGILDPGTRPGCLPACEALFSTSCATPGPRPLRGARPPRRSPLAAKGSSTRSGVGNGMRRTIPWHIACPAARGASESKPGRGFGSAFGPGGPRASGGGSGSARRTDLSGDGPSGVRRGPVHEKHVGSDPRARSTPSVAYLSACGGASPLRISGPLCRDSRDRRLRPRCGLEGVRHILRG